MPIRPGALYTSSGDQFLHWQRWKSQQAIAQLAEGTQWRDAAVTKLDVDFAGTGFHARWIFHRCQCGDLLVQVEQIAPDGIQSGQLLLVDGQVLLSRSLEPAGADLAEFGQAPTLMLQLTYALLNRSQPYGPAAVTDKQQWDVREKRTDLGINTGRTTGTFSAPWGVKGSVWRSDAGRHRFELSFQFTNLAPGPEPDLASGETATTGAMHFFDPLRRIVAHFR